MDKKERTRWASAIAHRISDEWDGSKQFPDDAVMLQAWLQKNLSKDVKAIKSFIGTGIIESDYFQSI